MITTLMARIIRVVDFYIYIYIIQWRLLIIYNLYITIIRLYIIRRNFNEIISSSSGRPPKHNLFFTQFYFYLVRFIVIPILIGLCTILTPGHDTTNDVAAVKTTTEDRNGDRLTQDKRQTITAIVFATQKNRLLQQPIVNKRFNFFPSASAVVICKTAAGVASEVAVAAESRNS